MTTRKISLASTAKTAAAAINKASKVRPPKAKAAKPAKASKPAKPADSKAPDTSTSQGCYRSNLVKALRTLTKQPLDKVSVPVAALAAAVAKYKTKAGNAQTLADAVNYGSLDDKAYDAGKVQFTKYGVKKYLKFDV